MHHEPSTVDVIFTGASTGNHFSVRTPEAGLKAGAFVSVVVSRASTAGRASSLDISEALALGE